MVESLHRITGRKPLAGQSQRGSPRDETSSQIRGMSPQQAGHHRGGGGLGHSGLAQGESHPSAPDEGTPGAERAGSCITRAPQPALWSVRFYQGAGQMYPGPRGLSREGYRGVTTMITGGARLTDGAGARTGEATRAGGATTTGCGKPFAGTVVTITGVRGAMTTCGVSTMVAGGTTPEGKTVTKPGCTGHSSQS
jgi:hypothetical protein